MTASSRPKRGCAKHCARLAMVILPPAAPLKRLRPTRRTIPAPTLLAATTASSPKIAERAIENEDLVNLPNWLPLTFRPEGGDWLNLLAVEVLSYRQELALQQGVLKRTMRLRDLRGRETTLVTRRLVHMGFATSGGRRVGDHARELVRTDRSPLRPRGTGDQRRGATLSPAQREPPRFSGFARGRRGRHPPSRRDEPVSHPYRRSSANAGVFR